MPSRRQFLTWTISSTALLSGGVLSLQFLQSEDFSQLDSDAFQFFTKEDQVLLFAITPVILGSKYLKNWEQQNLSFSQLLVQMDTAVRHFSSHTRQELRTLFDLLWNRLGKLLLAGIWSSWSQTDARAIDTFLNQWRESWLTTLNQGYQALQQLTMAAYFSESKSWNMCGYSGAPIKL